MAVLPGSDGQHITQGSSPYAGECALPEVAVVGQGIVGVPGEGHGVGIPAEKRRHRAVVGVPCVWPVACVQRMGVLEIEEGFLPGQLVVIRIQEFFQSVNAASAAPVGADEIVALHVLHIYRAILLVEIFFPA